MRFLIDTNVVSETRKPRLSPDVILLAATAKVHGMTLVTRDTGRLALHGITILNPFEPVR
jgi:predicted nucleic acid-binding protein